MEAAVMAERRRSARKLRDAERRLAELEATFQGGSRDLPFSFGYGGLSGSGPGEHCRWRFFAKDGVPLPTGLMLTAWRARFL